MKVGAFNINEPLPELKEPHALALLRPWVDVGGVGTLTLSWLETHFNAQPLGELARPGDFFDFTRYRPNSYIVEGRRQVTIPNARITYATQEAGNDFLFLHLLEPHGHGEDYVESISALLTKLGVKRYYLIGSMYDYVPHTKPLAVSGGGVGKEVERELAKLGITPGNYQGPTTITFLVSQRAPDAGIETMSLIVHLPQYAQVEENYIGAVQLIKALGTIYDIPENTTYARRAVQQMEQINAALEDNPQLKAIVEELEAHYEAQAQNEGPDKMPHLSPDVERFLRNIDRRFREG